jgi:activator of HSP90 ATPase
MTRAIQQSIVLKASPEELFETFLDSKKHTAATGMPAKVSRRTGGAFSAFGGKILGRTLMTVPGKMIVQSWRASHWKDEDLDSILVLRFTKAPSGGRIDLVHAGVPEHDHKGVTEGWPTFYWKPWKAYLAGR